MPKRSKAMDDTFTSHTAENTRREELDIVAPENGQHECEQEQNISTDSDRTPAFNSAVLETENSTYSSEHISDTTFTGEQANTESESTDKSKLELSRLRSLLFSSELTQLEDLNRRIKDPEAHAQQVSEVVTEALLLRSGKDDKLNTVLAPTVEHIFKATVRQNPEDIADELFPVMGPAIRRSIAETFRSMLQSFHKSLEMSFSTKGLRWRLQAMRTGRPFSEIVLLNTLVYRVEQIFLIHTETGLVLDHLVNDGVETQDADLVSGMLTAIQDFVVDCFAGGAKSGELESMQLADHKIFVVRSRRAYIACVIKGEPPLKLLSQLHTALDLILVECANALNTFNGDTANFKKARRYLEIFMVSRFADEGKEVPLAIKALPFVLIGLLLLGFLGLKFKQSYWHDAIDALNTHPGIVVTRVEPSLFGTWKIYVLQDTMANDPAKLLEESGFPANRFTVNSQPYLSLDGHLVRERVLQAISPPPGVVMTFDDNQVLHLSGEANMGWILATREKALAISGVKDVDIKGLNDPRTDKLRNLVTQVEGVSIYFPSDKSNPIPEDQAKLEQAVDSLVEIEKLAKEMGLSVNLIIYGHADATGSAKYNYDLSQDRAKTLAAMLYAKGASIPIATYGMGSDHALREESGRAISDQSSRKIELRVRLAQSGAVLPDFLAD